MNPLPLVAASALLSVSVSAEILSVKEVGWEHLLYREAEVPLDPASVDSDFHTTWQDPVVAGYDGPAFTAVDGYLGYGVIGTRTMDVNIWNPDGLGATNTPPSGSRHTVYVRTTITPTEPFTHLHFTGIIDDGIIIYLNGVELTRVNMPAKEIEPDTWILEAEGNGSESVPISEFVPAVLPLNEVAVLAVSLHNVSPTSSDIGFELGVESRTFTPVPNNDFADSIELSGELPIVVTGTNDNQIGGMDSVNETGEPNHAGVAGNSSSWWHYTATQTGRIAIRAGSPTMNEVLAVYTGDSVDGLTPVMRYGSLAVPASSEENEEPFFAGARVEFDAVEGVTYRIAVDGAGGGVGEVTLEIEEGISVLDPVAELLPARSDWEYLLLVGGANQPLDPGLVDADFYSTWHSAAVYDGPAFSGPSEALFGYGALDGDPIATNIWGGKDHNGDGMADTAPAAGLRYTAYFRTSFTPTVATAHLGFEGLIDDGAIIYVNGSEVARVNVGAGEDANSWLTLAADATPPPHNITTEAIAQYAIALNQNLAPDVPVEIAVSLHNSSSASSDLGFDLRVYAINVPGLGGLNLVIAPGAAAGEFVLSWNSSEGVAYLLESSADLETWAPVVGGDVTGDASGTSSVSDTPGALRRFYRVKEAIGIN
ncbi:MAG: hypothetical protein ACSHYF_14230 [Verrucomicrobiaceae bacterium]